MKTTYTFNDEDFTEMVKDYVEKKSGQKVAEIRIETTVDRSGIVQVIVAKVDLE